MVPFVLFEPGPPHTAVQVRLSSSSAAGDLAIREAFQSLDHEPPGDPVVSEEVAVNADPAAPFSPNQALRDGAKLSRLAEEFAADDQALSHIESLTALDWTDPLSPNPKPVDAESRTLESPKSREPDLRGLASLEPDWNHETSAESEIPLPRTRPASLSVEEAVDKTDIGWRGSREAKLLYQPGDLASVDRAEPSGTRHDLSSLLALLHEEITRNRQYPTIAKRQQREGTATVGFALHPNGAIEDLSVVSSSGFGGLDRAALLAVQEVAPFAPAGKYLNRAERFKVSIVFTLH